MPPTQRTPDNLLLSAPFEDLSGYEKGVLARAFLDNLIKQGNLETMPKADRPGEIVFFIDKWQLELLARFKEDISHVKTEQDLLRERLHQLA